MPFDFDDLVVDWQVVAGERNHGVVAASVAQKQDVSDFLASLEATGCSPRVLETEGFVLGNLAAVYDLPGVRLLADLGHRKTTVCLCEDGKPIAGRTVPVGGMAISEAIAKAGNLDLAEAERLKCETALLQGDDSLPGQEPWPWWTESPANWCAASNPSIPRQARCCPIPIARSF